VGRRQSDFALKAFAVFLLAVLYVASQHPPVSVRLSWTRTGVMSGTGTVRFVPLPFTPIFALPAARGLSRMPVSPSDMPILSVYLNPFFLPAFQHSFVPHILSAGTCAAIFKPVLSYRQRTYPVVVIGLPKSPRFTVPLLSHFQESLFFAGIDPFLTRSDALCAVAA